MREWVVELQKGARACGLTVDERVCEGVLSYLGLLLQWQRRINLTAVVDPRELIRFHFLEGFWAAENFLAAGERLVDIGSGAGFPGLAMKLYRPRVALTLLEASTKKSVFLRTACRTLGLSAEIPAIRAEDWAGWEGGGLASVRALKLGAALLSQIGQGGVSILQFEGERTAALPPPWVPRRIEVFPLSRQRRAVLYSAGNEPRTRRRGNVSRETAL